MSLLKLPNLLLPFIYSAFSQKIKTYFKVEKPIKVSALSPQTHLLDFALGQNDSSTFTLPVKPNHESWTVPNHQEKEQRLRNHHLVYAKFPFSTQESLDTLPHISQTTTEFVTPREQFIAHLILSIGAVGWDSNLEPKLEKNEEVKSSSLQSVLHFPLQTKSLLQIH